MIAKQLIEKIVNLTLEEDIGSGDITAQLIPKNQQDKAKIISKQPAIICGIQFVDTVYKQLDNRIAITWNVKDGDAISSQQTLCTLEGPTRSLLSGERCALNFLQTLSGTATLTAEFVAKIKNTKTKLLDTRKTLPGLRHAQKYAVVCGGGYNHRIGLYDAYLIKENHIAACAGSITKAVTTARKNNPDKTIEVEVTNLIELQEALNLPVDRIMLDNFNLENIKTAVKIAAGRIPLEISGNVSLENVGALAATGVDYISVGALTKNVMAVDFSMLFRIVP